MAETAGLVVGVIALSGLFNNAVQCFEFVQLGRTFGKDFQTSQVKLDSARLRLSRWGKSLNLDNDLHDTARASLQRKFGLDDNVKHAEDLLGQIIDLFAEAEGISERQKSRSGLQTQSLEVYDPLVDLEPPRVKLHDRMRKLAIERQNRTSLRQKAKWALYQEKHFRRLVEDINELVDNLVELFPATHQTQQNLCDQEVLAIEDEQSLSILKPVAATQDKWLQQAIERKTHDVERHYSIVFSGDGNLGVQIGHNSGTLSGFTFGKGA